MRSVRRYAAAAGRGVAGGFALFLYSYSDPVDGPGLEALASPWATFDILMSVGFVGIMWLAARIAVRR